MKVKNEERKMKPLCNQTRMTTSKTSTKVKLNRSEGQKNAHLKKNNNLDLLNNILEQNIDVNQSQNHLGCIIWTKLNLKY